MIIKEEKNVEFCSKCPFCASKRIYTADSFETVFELTCTKLDETVYTVDWNEEGKVDVVPSKCPFNAETSDDLRSLIERFKFQFAKLSMDEQMEFIRTDAFLNTIWKSGYAEAVRSLEADKDNPTEFESLGNHLRNLLSPYQFLVDSGCFDEIQFKHIIGNTKLQEGVDDIIEFSKHPKMEEINWR